MPTRIAILSDIHGDLSALEDALSLIERLQCDRIICAGDLVDYGFHPNEVVRRIRDLGIPCIKGNHDRWATGNYTIGDDDWGLADEVAEYLKSLPASWSDTIEGVRVAMHHASPGNDMAGIDPREMTGSEATRMLEKSQADVLVVGHTHIPFELEVAGRGKIVNPGALLREAEGGTPDHLYPGTIAILDLPEARFQTKRCQSGNPVEPTTRKLFS